MEKKKEKENSTNERNPTAVIFTILLEGAQNQTKVLEINQEEIFSDSHKYLFLKN